MEKNALKRGLVLGGGGSRGAYQVGCWRAMAEAGMHFDAITGTSVGALNGGMMVQGDLQKAWDFWSDMDVSLILTDMPAPAPGEGEGKTMRAFVRQFLKSGGADSTPLQNVVDRLVDEDRMRSAGIDFGIVTVDLRTGKPAELLLADMPAGTVTDYMLASATCFPAFRPKEIDHSLYIDGGYYDNLPLTLLLRSKKTLEEIWCIDIRGWGFNRKVKTPVPIHTVTSYWDLGGVLVFEKTAARRNLTLGYNDMRKRLGVLDGLAYTLEKGDAAFLDVRMGAAVERLLRRSGGSRPLQAKIEEFAESRVSETLAERLGKAHTLDRGDVVLAAAELAGEYLGVPPEPVYSLAAFHTALRQALGARVEQADAMNMEKLHKLGMLQRIAALRELAEDVPLLLLVELTRQLSAGTETMVPPEVLALAAPRHFLAAAYLAVLLEQEPD